MTQIDENQVMSWVKTVEQYVDPIDTPLIKFCYGPGSSEADLIAELKMRNKVKKYKRIIYIRCN